MASKRSLSCRLDAKTRTQVQMVFLMEDIEVIRLPSPSVWVSIKPDVRFVIHYDIRVSRIITKRREEVVERWIKGNQ